MSRKNLAWFMEKKWFLFMILNKPLCKEDAMMLRNHKQPVKAWGLGGCGASFNPRSKEWNNLFKKFYNKSK